MRRLGAAPKLLPIPTLHRNFVSLDTLDFALIGQLQKDGRRSLSELGRALGVSHGTIRNRLERLQTRGVVHIAAIVNPEAVGFPTHVLMAVNASLADLEAVERALVQLDEVMFVATVAGRFDFLIEGAFQSDHHLRDFIVRKLSRIKGILNTEPLHVLARGKRMWQWRIPAQAGRKRRT